MADTLCFYFQIHQPFRIRPFTLLDRGTGYFDHELNRKHLLSAVRKCYLPANALMTRLSRRHGDRFRVSFSISGTALEQFAAEGPEVIESFLDLAEEAGVEFLGETWCHSLASVFSPDEFLEQVAFHRERTASLFGAEPRIFRNTELIYDNDLAAVLSGIGFRGVLADGIEPLLESRSPNHLYRSSQGEVHLLLRNHYFSDNIAFRYSDRNWSGWPLRADRFAGDLRKEPGEFVCLFMDYETFGEHQRKETGIFAFIEEAVDTFLSSAGTRLALPSEIIASHSSRGVCDAGKMVSWADEARDLSAWTGNTMQKTAAAELYGLEGKVKASGNRDLLDDWRKLLASDHLYYISTKEAADGSVHDYFSPFPTPHDAFASFMNILHDLKRRVADAQGGG